MFAIRGDRFLIKSSNSGASWAQVTPVSGFPTTNFNHTAAYQNNLYLTNFSNSTSTYKGKGFFVSTDQGLNWVLKNNGLGNDTTLADMRVMSNGNIFVVCNYISGSTDVYKMYRSTDSGNNWTFIMTLNGGIGSLVEKSDGTYFLANTSGIFKSTSSGASWTLLPQSDPINTIFNGSIVIASNDSLYMNSSNTGFIRSLDGINWTVVQRTGWPGTQSGNSLIIAPNDSMFATLSTGPTSNYGVYMSPDLGKTWTKINTGLPTDPQIFDNQIWLSHKTGYLFC